MNIMISYRGIPNAPGWATGDSMVKAFRKLGHKVVPYGKYYQTDTWFGGTSKDFREVDFLLFMECNDADPQYAELKNLTCPKIYWEFDTAMREKSYNNQFYDYMGFDHIFFANPDALDWFSGRKNIDYLPYAIDTALIYPRHSHKEKNGVATIGSPFRERVEFCKKAGVRFIEGIYKDEYINTVSSLKIHVHNFNSGGSNLIVNRVWETFGCRTLLLSQHFPAMNRHFAKDLHYVTYEDAEDCKSKIEFYTKYQNLLEAITEQGYNEVIKKHQYVHRAKEILKLLEQN